MYDCGTHTYTFSFSPFQVPGLQHTSRPRAPHPRSSPTLPPLPGGTPLLQECAWWLPPDQYSDHLLQAAAKPGGVHSAEGRTGASHAGKLILKATSLHPSPSLLFSLVPSFFLPFFLHLPLLFFSPPPLIHPNISSFLTWKSVHDCVVLVHTCTCVRDFKHWLMHLSQGRDILMRMMEVFILKFQSIAEFQIPEIFNRW